MSYLNANMEDMKMKLHMSIPIRYSLVVLGNLPLWQELLLLIGWAAGYWLQ